MKNRPLAVQIWLVFAGLTLGISLLFLLLVPTALKGFFTEQMYRTIRESQELYLASDEVIAIEDLNKWDQRRQQYRSVEHMVFLGDGRVLTGLPPAPIRENYGPILQEASQQAREEQQYRRQVGDERIYYVIRRGQWAGQPAFLLSYMWQSYQNDLVAALFQRLLWVIGVLLILSWLPSFWLARYLTQPLQDIEQHVERIARRDWHQKIVCERQDEIGRLARSLELMRQQLSSQQAHEQAFLQQISHELKTPVMIIRSYVQAIADGVFPREGLAGSVKVIDEEAARLEKRIADLLYLTKLDYLSEGAPVREDIHLTELVEQVVDHFRWKRAELIWKLHLQKNVVICGDFEQWKTVLENLLDNQLRYAHSTVSVSLTEKSISGAANIELRIANDGPLIDPPVMERLFNRFTRGEKGQYGLGLAIVKQVVDYHQAKIEVRNESAGPAFYLYIPGPALK